MLLAGVSTLEIDSELVKSFINAAHFDDVFEVRKLLGFVVKIMMVKRPSTGPYSATTKTSLMS